MKFRRRNWWFRRMALGLAFAALAAPASGQAAADPYLTDISVRQGEALGGPDGGVPVSEPGPASPVQAKVTSTEGNWVASRDGAVALALGALALALAIGLAVGYARRPRIAGL